MFEDKDLPLYVSMFKNLEPRMQEVIFDLIKLYNEKIQISKEESIFDIKSEVKNIGLNKDFRNADDFADINISKEEKEDIEDFINYSENPKNPDKTPSYIMLLLVEKVCNLKEYFKENNIKKEKRKEILTKIFNNKNELKEKYGKKELDRLCDENNIEIISNKDGKVDKNSRYILYSFNQLKDSLFK